MRQSTRFDGILQCRHNLALVSYIVQLFGTIPLHPGSRTFHICGHGIQIYYFVDKMTRGVWYMVNEVESASSKI